MTCKCNTAKRDPDCTNPHSLSELMVDMAFPGLDRGPDAPEPCETCGGKGHIPCTHDRGCCTPGECMGEECPRCLGTGVQP